jgi:TolA-binding protein
MRHALGVTRKVALVLAVLTTAAIWSKPVTAQPAQPQEKSPSQEQQAQDVQQLKAKLQQLEQMMGEVKGQITALEGQPGTRDFRSCSSRLPTPKPFRIYHSNCETGTLVRFK